MDSLKFENQPGQQIALALACIATGATLSYGFRDFDSSGMTNSLAGFLLGLLLLVIGVSAFLAKGKQTIVIDPQARRIVIEDTNRFGRKKRIILFGEIVETGIGYLGKRSNYVNFYYIILRLRSGEEYPLFAPGRFFEGGSDRSVMEIRRKRLDELLQNHV